MKPDRARCQRQVRYIDAQFSPKNEKQHKRGYAQSGEDIRNNAGRALIGHSELMDDFGQGTRSVLRLDFCNQILG